MSIKLCYCGKPLHYNNLENFVKVSKLSDELGEFVTVHSIKTGKKYLVQRHYIALHGIKGSEIDSLGFKEAKE